MTKVTVQKQKNKNKNSNLEGTKLNLFIDGLLSSIQNKFELDHAEGGKR